MLSFIENIPQILKAVRESGAKKILDVGGGMGKYALLIMEDEISSRAEAGDMSPIPDIIIDCCEDTEYFVNKKHHNSLYSKHIHQDVFSADINGYDLVLFIDTVEHWDKDKTKALLDSIKCKKLVSTPKNTVMYHQHFFGDPRHHISQWNADDFSGKDYSTQFSHIFVI